MHPLPKASVACTMYYLPIIAFTMWFPLPYLERKTFGVGGNKTAVFAYHWSAKWVAKFSFELVSPNCVLILPSGHSGQGVLLGATVMKVFHLGCCDKVFCLVINYSLFGFATAPFSVTVMTI
jgi:hypothetical protein